MAEIPSLSLEAMGISLPYYTEGEQAVLGAIIIDSHVLDDVSGILLPEHFYHRQNAAIYKEMLLMSNAAIPIDIITVIAAVNNAGVFESEEDAKLYLVNITETVPKLTNVASYAKIVYEKYLLRALLGACREVIQNSTEEHVEASTLLDFAEQRIYEIRAGRDNSDLWKIDSVLFQVMEHLTRLSGEDRDKYRGLPTGYGDIDRTLTGLNRSDLIILAARPGVGKTSLALNMVTNVAMARPETSIAFFSLEMTKQQLAQRILSSITNVESDVFRTGNVRAEQWAGIAEATSSLAGTNIYLDDTSMISVQEMKAKARRLKNLGLIVVDYLQLMGGGGRSDSRVNEISDITRAFKIMAKELDVPIILLSQLSRDNEKQSRAPRLSDLRDSGSIEQDADIVLFIHREAGFGADGADQDEHSLIIAKNRHGELARIPLIWDGSHTRFYPSETAYEYD